MADDLAELANTQFKNRKRNERGTTAQRIEQEQKALALKEKMKPRPQAEDTEIETGAASRATKPIGKPSPFAVKRGIKPADRPLKLFFYGDYGAGKTVIAAQSVDIKRMRDVLIIDIEGGLESVASSGAVERFEDIDTIECKSFETFVAIHKMLMAYCQARDDNDVERIERIANKYGLDPEKRYRTIIIDFDLGAEPVDAGQKLRRRYEGHRLGQRGRGYARGVRAKPDAHDEDDPRVP